jgi:two-component system chemotaxis response regulator CheY
MRTRAEQSGALFLIAKPFTAESFETALTPVIG